MTGMIDALYKRILLAAHPVGSIYQSTVATSPATLFGGSWTVIESRFLLAASSAYPAGSTGGEATHTLTIEEMPEHYHSIGNGEIYNALGDYGYNGQMSKDPNSGQGVTYGRTNVAGSGCAHNTMPPYEAVYMWERTA